MKKKIRPSGVKGTIQAPPSKSFAQRAVAVAALAQGRSQILRPGSSDDVLAAVNVAVQLGADVNISDNILTINGGISHPAGILDCGEAGLSIRMFSSVAAIFDRPVTLSGKGSLLNRPMSVVEESLRAMGVECTTSEGFLPLTVRGPIRGGTAVTDGSLSSQVLTGMLIAAPYSRKDLEIIVNNLKSRPYIDITLEVMESFGVKAENRDYSIFSVKSGQRYRPCRYTVEGDWSAAAFLLVAGAIGGVVSVQNINPVSPQADKAILEALEKSGSSLEIKSDSVTVKKQELKAFDFDATHCPDLFPPLVSLAANCKGTTTIRGASRLVHKESNRAETLMEEFGKLDIKISVDNDVMRITGGKCSQGHVVSHGDHRIAMACAVAAIAGSGEVEIDEAEAVAKSYPDFFKDLGSLMTKEK